MDQPEIWDSPVRIAVFAAVTGFLLWLSRKSLAHPRVHGFWRFFAFESILTLLLRGAPVWFADAWSARQLLSWLLLCASVVPVVAGSVQLHRHGAASGHAGGEADFAFERTTRLVTGGIFRWIRHPMYASLIGLAWGAALKRPDVAGLALALIATALLRATAGTEERENIARFGADYSGYMERTRRFLPGVW